MGITFTTFNFGTDVNLGPVAQRADYRQRSPQLIEDLEKKKLGHVITLQGLPEEGIQELKRLQDYHVVSCAHYNQANAVVTQINEGLAILLRKDRFDWTQDAPIALKSPDAANLKTSLIVRVIEKSTQKVMTIFNTHVAEDHTFAQNQLNALVQRINHLCADPNDLIIGGGFFASRNRPLGTPLPIDCMKTNFATYLSKGDEGVYLIEKFRPFDGIDKGEPKLLAMRGNLDPYRGNFAPAHSHSCKITLPPVLFDSNVAFQHTQRQYSLAAKVMESLQSKRLSTRYLKFLDHKLNRMCTKLKYQEAKIKAAFLKFVILDSASEKKPMDMAALLALNDAFQKARNELGINVQPVVNPALIPVANAAGQQPVQNPAIRAANAAGQQHIQNPTPIAAANAAGQQPVQNPAPVPAANVPAQQPALNPVAVPAIAEAKPTPQKPVVPKESEAKTSKWTFGSILLAPFRFIGNMFRALFRKIRSLF